MSSSISGKEEDPAFFLLLEGFEEDEDEEAGGKGGKVADTGGFLDPACFLLLECFEEEEEEEGGRDTDLLLLLVVDSRVRFVTLHKFVQIHVTCVAVVPFHSVPRTGVQIFRTCGQHLHHLTSVVFAVAKPPPHLPSQDVFARTCIVLQHRTAKRDEDERGGGFKLLTPVRNQLQSKEAHRRGYRGAQERIQERRGARREEVCTVNIFELGSKNLQILQKTLNLQKSAFLGGDATILKKKNIQKSI